MKKTVVFTMLIAVLLLVTACQPSIDEAKAAFCEDLGQLGLALANYRSLDESSTIDEVEAAQQEVEKAWNELEKSANTLGNVQTDEMEEALQDLQKSVTDISGDTTVGDATTTVQQNVLATLEEVVRISNTVCSYGQQ